MGVVRKDLLGKKNGRWTVVGETQLKNKYGYILWDVVCDCGNVSRLTSNNFKHSESCGCLTKERMSKTRKGRPSPARKEYGVSTFNMLRARYIKRARDKNIQYTLNDDFLKSVFSQDCFYCGEKPKSVMRTKDTYGEYVYNGLDRIDSSVGYVENNVVPCCTRCNQMKNNMSITLFKEKIEAVYARIKGWGAVL